MSGPLSEELARRARRLLNCPRKESSSPAPSVLLNELVLPGLILDASVQGTLMIEMEPSGKVIYMESPNGTVIRTSPAEDLEAAIEILKRHMVLDDLADV